MVPRPRDERLPTRSVRVLHIGGGWPVALFSPGSGTSRSLYTALVEDLASRGFVVLAMDHEYDIDGVRAVDIEQIYLTAYFEHTLRYRPAPLLSRPDPCYPEILFEG